MLRRYLDRRQILVAGQDVDLLGRGDVEYMHAPSGLAHQAHQPVGRADRRLRITPFRMHRHIGAVLDQSQTLTQPRLVLRFELDRNGKIAELWDVGQAIPAESPNENGML